MPFGHPNVTASNLTPTSGATDAYNCLAWAVHYQDLPIWPDPFNVCSWPPDMPRIETIDSIRLFLERVGFQRCQTTDVEAGYEKVAIYADQHGPQHIARQLPSGSWTSKLGVAIDASHSSLSVLEDGSYGNVAMLMKRRAGTLPNLPPLFPPRPRLVSTTGSPLIR
ncbi:DUF7689 domain-containing protein [Bradyrhizobium elkanii]|uniref:DUF7689 domain-containing protein n=1 Tax=Bradyrhizobium elkanii TaxID=29448 RepID=UPI003B96985C